MKNKQNVNLTLEGKVLTVGDMMLTLICTPPSNIMNHGEQNATLTSKVNGQNAINMISHKLFIVDFDLFTHIINNGE